jgi:hypothetical protein
MERALLTDIIKSSVAISPRTGQMAYDYVINALNSNNEQITISFHGISDCTSAFLNSFIGKLYMNFESSHLDKVLNLVDIEANKTWFNKIHNAKLLGSNENYRTIRKASINELLFS